MAELLEVLHLPDHDRVAEVDVGRGGIEADLDRQRLAAAELRLQIVAFDEIDRPLARGSRAVRRESWRRDCKGHRGNLPGPWPDRILLPKRR